MSVHLSPELVEILKERLVFTSEFIEAAILFALENDEFKKKWLQQELQKGIEQADRGELYDWEEVLSGLSTSRTRWQTSSSPARQEQT